MSSVIDVYIARIADDRYSVKLIDRFTNDLGEMTQTKLLAYLSVRSLLDVTPGQVIKDLKVGDQTTVHFQRAL
jgi:hypothetical protein